MRIDLADPPDATTDAAIADALRAEIEAAWGPAARRPLAFYLRNDAGQVVGGLLGHLAWGWLYIRVLWVREDVRGLGHGRALLERAMDTARAEACMGIHVDTFGEAALPFYQGACFTPWGTLEQLPPGGRQHHLMLRLR